MCKPHPEAMHERSKILIPILLFILLAATLLAVLLADWAALRGRHPLPSRPIALHQLDCVWIMDSDTDTVTHGPFRFSRFWNRTAIGDVQIAPSGDMYISLAVVIVPERGAGTTVVHFDPARARVVSNIEVQMQPNQMAWGSDGLLYVSAHGARTSYRAAVDTASDMVVGEVTLDRSHEQETLISGADGRLYYAAPWTLASIDPVVKAVSYSPAQFGSGIKDMALGPDGFLYLLLDDEIRVVDPEEWQEVARFSRNAGPGACSGANIASLSGKVIVTCYVSREIQLYDAANHTAAVMPLPDAYPEIVGVSNGKLYLLQTDAKKVLVLDSLSGEILVEVPLPQGCH